MSEEERKEGRKGHQEAGRDEEKGNKRRCTDHSPFPIYRRLCRKVERNSEDVDVRELIGEFSSKVLEVGPVWARRVQKRFKLQSVLL